MENVAIVQPTQHFKNKELNIRKNIPQSPTRGANPDSKLTFLFIFNFIDKFINNFIRMNDLIIANIHFCLFLVNAHLSQKKIREVPPYRDPPGPASPPLRTLPPYRDPPPPNLNSPARSQFASSTNSNIPHIHKEEQPSSSNTVKLKRNLIQVV